MGAHGMQLLPVYEKRNCLILRVLSAVKSECSQPAEQEPKLTCRLTRDSDAKDGMAVRAY